MGLKLHIDTDAHFTVIDDKTLLFDPPYEELFRRKYKQVFDALQQLGNVECTVRLFLDTKSSKLKIIEVSGTQEIADKVMGIISPIL